MKDDMVAVEHFGSRSEAELAASALHAAGIVASVGNGMWVMVRQNDLAAAREVLHGTAVVPLVRDVTNDDHFCASCGRPLPKALTECPVCNAGEYRPVFTPERAGNWHSYFESGVYVLVLATILVSQIPADVARKAGYALLAVIAAIAIVLFLRRASEERL